jgi:hypothetical protein
MPTITVPTINISKTTLNGYLTVALVICGALTQVPHVPLWLSGGATTILGIWRIVVGTLQQDADSTKALVPGIPEPQMVPAHPVPDNPHDIAVK